MKIVILKNNLKNGLDAINKVVSDNSNTLPILKNFLLDAEDNKIKLIATNLEIAITIFISGKIVEKGSLTIPFNIFYSIINNLQNERITLESEKEILNIQTDNYQAKIQGIKKEEFPIIPSLNHNQIGDIEFDISILKEAFLSVINASSFTNARQELNGLLFDFQVNILKLAATDSFRLAEKIIFNNQFSSNIEKHFKVIIPIKTISEVIRVFQENNKKIKIFFDNNQVLFQSEDLEIISRLINGEFPDYQTIIPKNIETEIIVNKNEFINALKLTGSFSDKFNEIRIIVKEKTKSIEIFSSYSGLGENRYLIPAKVKGIPIEIIFNWRFLIAGIKELNVENIFLGFSTDDKPAIIKSPDDKSYFYILMPIKSA
jgi:DNA polymerase-3 subunit beta